jgi:hypothetical protein
MVPSRFGLTMRHIFPSPLAGKDSGGGSEVWEAIPSSPQALVRLPYRLARQEREKDARSLCESSWSAADG